LIHEPIRGTGKNMEILVGERPAPGNDHDVLDTRITEGAASRGEFVGRLVLLQSGGDRPFHLLGGPAHVGAVTSQPSS
jgi:hypothetical protein